MIDVQSIGLGEQLPEAGQLEDGLGEDLNVVLEADEHALLDPQEPGVLEVLQAHVRERDVQLPEERVADQDRQAERRRGDEHDRDGVLRLDQLHEEQVEQPLEHHHDGSNDDERQRDLPECGLYRFQAQRILPPRCRWAVRSIREEDEGPGARPGALIALLLGDAGLGGGLHRLGDPGDVAVAREQVADAGGHRVEDAAHLEVRRLRNALLGGIRGAGEERVVGDDHVADGRQVARQALERRDHVDLVLGARRPRHEVGDDRLEIGVVAHGLAGHEEGAGDVRLGIVVAGEHRQGADAEVVPEGLRVAAEGPVAVDDEGRLAVLEEAVGDVVVGLGRHHLVGVLEVVHELEGGGHGRRVEGRRDAVLGEDGAAEPAQERDEPEGLGLVEDDAVLVGRGRAPSPSRPRRRCRPGRRRPQEPCSNRA